VQHYALPPEAKVLDIGCGKEYLMYDMIKVATDAKVNGIDISSYAVQNSKQEVR